MLNKYAMIFGRNHQVDRRGITSRYYGYIIYLDFQKAFDKVPHKRLLLKLKAHCIGVEIIDWREQWLTDRRQCVVVDGEVSNCKSFLSGVPQGSVLGPLLFLIHCIYQQLG